MLTLSPERVQHIPSVAAPEASEPALIEARGICKFFGRREAEANALLAQGLDRAEILQRIGTVVGLNRVSFDVRRGEILVVMGLSGSGKSTLLRCLNRLIEPSAGKLRVGDVDVVGLGAKELREFRRTTFGMVFQHFALFPHRTILANVEYGLEIRGMSTRARRDAAMAAIELVGLKGWERKHPSELSGGMKQRAGLARALAADAEILLMDEAFSALDPLIRREMQQELVALQNRLHKTIVFVSHDLDEAIALGGRILLMKDGAVVQDGLAEEILAHPANDYAARFVAHADIASVVTVAQLMGRGRLPLRRGQDVAAFVARARTAGQKTAHVADESGRVHGRAALDRLERLPPDADCVAAAEPCPTLSPGMTLRQALPVLAASPEPAAVLCERGTLLGTLDPTAALAAIARIPPAPAEEPAQ